MLYSSFYALFALNAGIAYSSAISYRNYTSNRAVYFSDNAPSGTSIIALSIADSDGLVSNPVKTPTGGKGLDGLLAISQDSVVVSGKYLFVTNAGSNTLSFFVIDNNDPLHPKLIGNPAPTLGETPVTVAYSPKLNTACVANSGTTAGVTCFSVDESKGLTALGGLRPIPQTQNSDPTPPPAGPVVISGDIAFNPSQTAVFVSVRSNGAQPGLIRAFPVENGQVGTTNVVSSLPSLPFAFSLNFLDNNDSHLLILNPLPNTKGAAFVNVAYPSLEVTLDEDITIPGQGAVCWAAYAPQLDSVYLIDALYPHITNLNPETGDIKLQNDNAYTTPTFGGEDSKIDRNWLYVLTDAQPAGNMTSPMNSTVAANATVPANSSALFDARILVFDVAGGGLKQVQDFAVEKLQYQQGLAIYPS